MERRLDKVARVWALSSPRALLLSDFCGILKIFASLWGPQRRDWRSLLLTLSCPSFNTLRHLRDADHQLVASSIDPSPPNQRNVLKYSYRVNQYVRDSDFCKNALHAEEGVCINLQIQVDWVSGQYDRNDPRLWACLTNLTAPQISFTHANLVF